MIGFRSLFIHAALAAALIACRPGEEPVVTTPGAAPDRAPSTAGFRPVVDAVLPSIVFIQAEAVAPPGLEQLLPRGHPLPDAPVPIGAGSGVLISEDGYILTNNHVVQDAERVTVVLHDRRYFDAQVVGRDPATEVAVVKIPGNGLSVARLADSDAVGLGDWVLALGSPLGLQFSVTAGIVSGTGRTLGILAAHLDPAEAGAAPLEHFIQTDAAMSPGNSGGPLVNADGEVVGINTAVAAPRGMAAGYGFAIPSNLARRVADQLIQHGEVRRPYLGVLLRDIAPSDAGELGLRTVEGAQVQHVEPGSPASRGGLEPGDVIRGIEGRPVRTVSDLQVTLAHLDPGTTVRVSAIRGGREIDVSVELGVVRSGVGAQRPATPATAPQRPR